MVVVLSGCNTIDDENRLLDYEPAPVGEKMILIEEFTGQNCPNCPAGAAEAKRIQELYEHKVVVVAIHAGVFATRSEFLTPAGTEYWSTFYGKGNSTGYPAAMFNRTAVGGLLVSTGFNTGQWSAFAKESFEKPVDLSLKLESKYNQSNRSLIVTSIIESNSIIENAKILLLLTESKIYARQKSGEEVIPDYEHNHVLRGAIGDQDATPNYWGNDVAINPSEPTVTISIPYVLNEKWKPENMNIVGIVFNNAPNANKEVMQVAEISIINELNK